MRVFRIAFLCASAAAMPLHADSAKHDYPTVTRVEYVQECLERNGGAIANVYKCSCVIDWIARKLTHDEFVEAQTFAKYARLPGEAGGVFRDPPEAKKKAELYRTVEADAYERCGLHAK